jgi:5-dehydro-2-deoxygluconokinase
VSRPDELYILAADHRWQWHDWCDAHGRPRDVIPELKAIAVAGFLAARERSDEVRARGAMLLDELYSGPMIADLRAREIAVAAPVEKAGAFPLEWGTEPFWAALTGSMAKVLVRFRPEYPQARVEAEQQALRELSDWCREQSCPWMLEVVVPSERHENEEQFAREVRPAVVAGYIAEAYARGIQPDYWKMEGTTSEDGARLVDEAIQIVSGPSFLVLGKAAPLGTIEQWFRAAHAMKTAAGFAIGRSIYWDPAARFARGEISRDQAIEIVADTYLATIGLWQKSATPATAT